METELDLPRRGVAQSNRNHHYCTIPSLGIAHTQAVQAFQSDLESFCRKKYIERISVFLDRKCTKRFPICRALRVQLLS